MVHHPFFFREDKSDRSFLMHLLVDKTNKFEHRSFTRTLSSSIKTSSASVALCIAALDEDAEVMVRFTFAKHASYITLFQPQTIGILHYRWASSESVTVWYRNRFSMVRLWYSDLDFYRYLGTQVISSRLVRKIHAWYLNDFSFPSLLCDGLIVSLLGLRIHTYVSWNAKRATVLVVGERTVSLGSES